MSEDPYVPSPEALSFLKSIEKAATERIRKEFKEKKMKWKELIADLEEKVVLITKEKMDLLAEVQALKDKVEALDRDLTTDRRRILDLEEEQDRDLRQALRLQEQVRDYGERIQEDTVLIEDVLDQIFEKLAQRTVIVTNLERKYMVYGPNEALYSKIRTIAEIRSQIADVINGRIDPILENTEVQHTPTKPSDAPKAEDLADQIQKIESADLEDQTHRSTPTTPASPVAPSSATPEPSEPSDDDVVEIQSPKRPINKHRCTAKGPKPSRIPVPSLENRRKPPVRLSHFGSSYKDPEEEEEEDSN